MFIRSIFARLGRSLYLRVIVGIAVGITIGLLAPRFAVELKPLGDGFIAFIKMLIGPVIFCTVVTGIAGAGSMKKVGRVGIKALVYFEVVSSIALALGMIVANVLKPGHGFNVDVHTLDPALVSGYAQKAQEQNVTDFILHIIPRTLVDAFTGNGDLLQVLLVALLFGYALLHTQEKSVTILNGIQALSKILFKMVAVVMELAPIGAGGAMAFTIGKYGLGSILPLISLMGCFYLTCILFIFGILGLVAYQVGFNIFRFIYYIKDELFTVLGTSSSESVLVPMMEKLEKLGCSKSVVGLVIPAGYSFNLDGTNIYLTLAALFVAQALNIDLSLGQQLSLLLVASISSKGASGVTGAGFITLAATLAAVPDVPIAGLTLILGIDRFMSEARALTNTIGNGVATIAIARWEGELDAPSLEQELRKSLRT
jgi:aerobic C4-dicarboxylate transport protein